MRKFGVLGVYLRLLGAQKGQGEEIFCYKFVQIMFIFQNV